MFAAEIESFIKETREFSNKPSLHSFEKAQVLGWGTITDADSLTEEEAASLLRKSIQKFLQNHTIFMLGSVYEKQVLMNVLFSIYLYKGEQLFLRSHLFTQLKTFTLTQAPFEKVKTLIARDLEALDYRVHKKLFCHKLSALRDTEIALLKEA